LKRRVQLASLAALALASLSFRHASAQAVPTASRAFDLSAFGGVSGVYTGLGDGKNLSITAGVDLGFRRFFGVHPAVEIRGTYPVDSGQLVNEKNVLGGIKVLRRFGRLTPYGDALFGRGLIKYINGYIVTLPDGSQIEYLQNPSNILSGGGGVDFSVTNHFSIKADGQFQRYNSPVTASGHLYSKPLTLGVVYKFNFGQYPVR
jgi:hypothetical protein